MKPLFLLLLSLCLISCADGSVENTTATSTPLANGAAAVKNDSVILSFAFTGCNRVGWEKGATPSTANHVPLDSIFMDMQHLERQPEFFFNLGDIVRAEQSDVSVLDSQLKAWVGLKAVNDFDASGIKMLAVPGNHELLQSINKSKEYPLDQSTQVWTNYMGKYMPKNPNFPPAGSGILNQLSYSFTHGNVGFVVLNTDTYNPAPNGQNFGEEGLAPIKWAIGELEKFKANPNIKHSFVLGHRSYYVYGEADYGHGGLPNGGTLWMGMQETETVAYLSAHTHDYNRYQHNGKGVTQIIAGNAGSPGSSSFFGYSRIDVYASGQIALESRGYCVPANRDDYKKPNLNSSMQLRDSALLQWDGNTNALSSPYTVGCSDN